MAALAATGIACLGGAALAAKPAERLGPSGLPVPRWVALKFNTVNARGGPGDDYRLLWVYKARGLPLQVVAETKEWRRVCDPMGGLAWVKSTGVDGRRTVLAAGAAPVPLLSKPEAGSRLSATLRAHALAALDRCKDGWCKVSQDSGAGWAPASAFWGSDERIQCRPSGG